VACLGGLECKVRSRQVPVDLGQTLQTVRQNCVPVGKSPIESTTTRNAHKDINTFCLGRDTNTHLALDVKYYALSPNKCLLCNRLP